MTDVVCAGILVADTFCGPMRQLPAAGELLTVDRMPSKAGGCAANVAINLVKQGVHAEIAGLVGDDTDADMLLACLRKGGVDCSRVEKRVGSSTSKTVILLVEGQDRRYIHTFGANAVFAVKDMDRETAASARVFYLGGLFAMPGVDFAELADLLAYCRKCGVKTVVDVVIPRQGKPSLKNLAQVLPHIDYFMSNGDEALTITGCETPEKQIRALRSAGARDAVIMLGVRGAVATRGKDILRAGTYPMPVADPSGSGDAYCAGIITGLFREWDLSRSLEYAAALGASAVRAIGTTDGVFTGKEAENFIAAHPLKIEHLESIGME